MDGKTQVNFWVDDEQKEKWEEYLDEEDSFTTLSGLIRASVESHIAGEDNGQDSSSPAVSSDIQNLSDELSEMKQDVSWMRKEMQDDDTISDLAQEVYDELVKLPEKKGAVDVPEGMDEKAYRQRMGAEEVIIPEDMEELDSKGESPQTASAIAEQVGTTDSKVRDAIDHLKDQFLPVVEVEIGNQVHYFKEE